MEKFSNWRDKGTGISPFMPAVEPLIGVIGYFAELPKAILLLVKIPILAIALAVYYIVPLGALNRFILLVLVGLRRSDFSVEGVKRSKVDEVNAARPKTNEVYVVNYVSPLDGLIVAGISQVSWRKILILVPNARGEIFEYSVWSFMRLAFSHEIGKEASSKRYEESHAKDRLTLYFAEGTSSNNKAVLPFSTGLTCPPSTSVGTLVIKLQPPNLVLPLPIRSKMAYFFKALSNYSKISGIKIKAYKQKSFDLNESRESFQLSGLSQVGKDLNIPAKQKFFDYYLDYKLKKE